MQAALAQIHRPTLRFYLLAGLVGLATAVASSWPLATQLGDHVVDGARLASQ